MKNPQKINNVKDLQAEIARLHVRRDEQEAYLSDQYRLLKQKVDMPFLFLKRITAYIPGVGALKGITSGLRKAVKNKDADWLTKVLQLGTPIVLNSTLLRKAGWLKKAMVMLASETAIGQVNQNNISGLVNRISDFIKPKKKKKKKKEENIIEDRFATDQLPVPEDEKLPGT